jgi:hypothetical protein
VHGSASHRRNQYAPAPSAAHVALLLDFLDGEEHALGRHRRIETNREFVIGDTADSPSY